MQGRSDEEVKIEVKEDNIPLMLLPTNKAKDKDFSLEQLFPRTISHIVLSYLQNLELTQISLSPGGRNDLMSYFLHKIVVEEAAAKVMKNENFFTDIEKEAMVELAKKQLIDLVYAGNKEAFRKSFASFQQAFDKKADKNIDAVCGKKAKCIGIPAFIIAAAGAYLVFELSSAAHKEIAAEAAIVDPKNNLRNSLYGEYCSITCDDPRFFSSKPCAYELFLRICNFALNTTLRDITWPGFEADCIDACMNRNGSPSLEYAILTSILIVGILGCMSYCLVKAFPNSVKKVMSSKADLASEEMILLKDDIISYILSEVFKEIPNPSVKDILRLNPDEYEKGFAIKVCENVQIGVSQIPATFFNDTSKIAEKKAILKAQAPVCEKQCDTERKHPDPQDTLKKTVSLV